MAFFSRIAQVAAAIVLCSVVGAQNITTQNVSTQKAAQNLPDSTEILNKSAETYAHLSEFDVASTTTATGTSASGATSKLLIRTHWTARGTTKIRLAEESEVGSLQRSSLVVADGENLWAYSTRTNEYTKAPIAELPSEVLSYAREGVSAYFQTKVDHSKLLGEETIDVGGQNVDCFVVELTRTLKSGQPAISTRWIDKKRFVVVREDQPAGDPAIGPTRTIWLLTNLNQTTPDEAFTFVPPPGAKLVKQIAQ
jgi:outer membrane lipoprotein-sorting protein